MLETCSNCLEQTVTNANHNFPAAEPNAVAASFGGLFRSRIDWWDIHYLGLLGAINSAPLETLRYRIMTPSLIYSGAFQNLTDAKFCLIIPFRPGLKRILYLSYPHRSVATDGPRCRGQSVRANHPDRSPHLPPRRSLGGAAAASWGSAHRARAGAGGCRMPRFRVLRPHQRAVAGCPIERPGAPV